MAGPATPSTLGGLALRRAFRDDVLAGLARSPKSIPAKHIYDARGSELFEQITELDEYYLTRTERAIFAEHLPAMAEAIGPGATIVEPGAGSGDKAAMLLSGLDDPKAYVPIEISRAALATAAERIASEFPEVETQPVCADFTAAPQLPLLLREGTGGWVGRKSSEQSHDQSSASSNDGPETTDHRPVVFFPGSTIGNFEAPDRTRLWKRFARLVGDGMVLIGFDLVKSADLLLPAYDDSEGVTAEFNTNLLHRINRELAGDFDVDAFEYFVKWNTALQCVEMSQRSRADQVVCVAGEEFLFRTGEHLRTERSHKFTLERMDSEASTAGFSRVGLWTDPRTWFGVALYQR
jgi:uncharacterized SAM-dependent methyltransferase